MEDFEINDDEEEKLPQDMRTELREEHQSISNDEMMKRMKSKMAKRNS